MTGTGTPELAAAVSNAGGLGIFAAHNAGSPEGCRQWIRKIRTLTSKPFGVNLTILPTMGKPPPYEEYANVIIEEGVKIVETAGSNPKKWIPMFKKVMMIMVIVSFIIYSVDNKCAYMYVFIFVYVGWLNYDTQVCDS